MPHDLMSTKQDYLHRAISLVLRSMLRKFVADCLNLTSSQGACTSICALESDLQKVLWVLLSGTGACCYYQCIVQEFYTFVGSVER